MAITLSDQTKVRPSTQFAVVIPYEAGAAVSLGDAVYLDANSKVQKAQADDSATAEAIGIVVSGGNLHNRTGDYAAGDTVGVCVLGIVEGFSAMTEGAGIYVSAATAGDLTETAPSSPNVVKLIGYPLSDSKLMVNPGGVAVTGASA